MQQLEGRVAMITGAGSGIDEGFAHACHDAGMRVVVSDIEQGEAERVLDGVRADRQFIFTHPDQREAVEARRAQLMADYDAIS